MFSVFILLILIPNAFQQVTFPVGEYCRAASRLAPCPCTSNPSKTTVTGVVQLPQPFVQSQQPGLLHASSLLVRGSGHETQISLFQDIFRTFVAKSFPSLFAIGHHAGFLRLDLGLQTFDLLFDLAATFQFGFVGFLAGVYAR